MKMTLSILVVAIYSLLLTSCGPKAFVKGQYDDDINRANLLTDRWSESDMQKAVSDLVRSLKSHRSISQARRPPVVMVTRLQNRTSEHIDTKSIMDMLSDELMRGGEVVFVDKSARDDIAEEYEYQKGNASRESRKESGGQIGADFILNGRLSSIVQTAGRDKTVYYKLNLNMTNLKTGLKAWADYKQIRKIYRKNRIGL